MLAKKDSAAPHLPIAHGRSVPPTTGSRADSMTPAERRHSRSPADSKLQVTVVGDRKRDDEVDPYADVPCTD